MANPAGSSNSAVVLAPTDVGEALLPRRYQEEIFTRAQEGNVIAALETGSGKTFISILLMKWITSRHSGDKKIVFLVPKVALVEQQADFIVKQTPLRVSRFYGATAIDMTDRQQWREQFDNSDVLVMTAQIFLNIVTHSHWSMDKISLMVFDECHHTRKNHAYNGIMREYFVQPLNMRPKIFGMTASPIWNPKDAAESLAALERNMDAKVIAVREHAEELMNHLPKPTEVVLEYPPPPNEYPTYPAPLLRELVEAIRLPQQWEIPWDKIEARYDVTLQSLGPFCAEFYLYTEMKQRIIALFTQDSSISSNKDMFIVDPGPLEWDFTDNDNFVPPSAEVVELDALLAKYIFLFSDPDRPETIPVDVPLEWCTPQIHKLVDLLSEHYTQSFQGIVFVEQRHVAMALARILPRIPQLHGKIKSAELVGHGAAVSSRAQLKGMGIQNQQDVVRMFREGDLNLLIATSVAEEGLDFPACDIVIRFDVIQHMVGYLQSRGRARHKSSKFVVMVQEGHAESLTRYLAFAQSEPELKQFYQQQNTALKQPEEEPEEGEIDEDPFDVAERERYTVPSTGAVLTYNSAVALLNNLCSLIPRDRFTPIHIPVYSGEFEVKLQLPSSLPLPPENLVYYGPSRRSKKEAKRAVAFLAVKQLHALGVFNDFLLPAGTISAAVAGDNDGPPLPNVKNIPDMMDVEVRDPWTMDDKLWIHVAYLDAIPSFGLVTGTQLPPSELQWNGVHIQMTHSRRVVLQAPLKQREIMQEFTRVGLWWTITGRGIRLPLAAYLVPIDAKFRPDFGYMEEVIAEPWGTTDWSSISEMHYHRLMCMNNKEHGRPLLLRRIRDDMTPMSRPPPGSREGAYPTYREWYIQKWMRKGVKPDVPEDGPLAEVEPLPRQMSAAYNLLPGDHNEAAPVTTQKVMFVPLAFCRWSRLTERLWRAFHLLPRLMRRVTDVYRVRSAKAELRLPQVPDNLLVEAYTLPSSNASHSNQRFETLGDSVLKLSVVVDLFNKFPHRHEGQLDTLRRSIVSNKALLARAKDIGLEHYLTSESSSIKTWRYTLPEGFDWKFEPRGCRSVPRLYPRRSLQDSMEAMLGASFAAGGISLALQTSVSINVPLGGVVPWSVRYSRNPEPSPTPHLFHQLQQDMGYTFHRGELLLEAVTHPSFQSHVGPSYQRLEFMGDALIDLVVTHYLYRKFPSATSGQLSWARSRAVCAPALASVAVKRLGLHKILLMNNVELGIAIGRYVPILQEITDVEIIHKGWKHDPPKALSDVLESVLGAVLVDTAYNLDRTTAVVEFIMGDLLEVLSPNLPKDPVSQLMISTAKAGCRQISFRKTRSSSIVKANDGVSVIVHDIVVAGPIGAANLSLAKGLASERAQEVLGDPNHKFYLPRVCDCGKTMDVDVDVSTNVLKSEVAETEGKAPDDETIEGFAAIAQETLDKLEPYVGHQKVADAEQDGDGEDHTDQPLDKPTDR